MTAHTKTLELWFRQTTSKVRVPTSLPFGSPYGQQRQIQPDTKKVSAD